MTGHHGTLCIHQMTSVLADAQEYVVAIVILLKIKHDGPHEG